MFAGFLGLLPSLLWRRRRSSKSLRAMAASMSSIMPLMAENMRAANSSTLPVAMIQLVGRNRRQRPPGAYATGTGGRAQGPRLSHAKSDSHRRTGTVDRFPQSGMVSREATAAGWVLGAVTSGGRAGRRPVVGRGMPARCFNAGQAGTFRRPECFNLQASLCVVAPRWSQKI